MTMKLNRVQSNVQANLIAERKAANARMVAVKAERRRQAAIDKLEEGSELYKAVAKKGYKCNQRSSMVALGLIK